MKGVAPEGVPRVCDGFRTLIGVCCFVVCQIGVMVGRFDQLRIDRTAMIHPKSVLLSGPMCFLVALQGARVVRQSCWIF